MKVTLKKTGDNRVRLDAIATADEVNQALQAAHVAFAQSMGLQPQPGKTVAEIAEEHMGIKNLDSIVEASAIDALVPWALDKKNIIPAYPPKAEVKTPFKRDRQFSFAVNVALKPDYELTSYEPVSITVPAFAVDEALVDQQITEMANRYVTYVTDDPRPVKKGDCCLISMKCFENGEPVKGLTTDGRTYVTGQGYMPDGFDEQVIGMQPGETKSFRFEGPGFDENYNEITQTIDCTLTVQEIQKQEIPVIDDEWVKTNLPMYKSFADLRKDILRNIERQQREGYENYKRQLVAGELARRFQGSIADEVYEAMRAHLLNDLRSNLNQQGKTWESFVEENGGEQQLGMMLMVQTREMLVQGYALDAIYRHEHLTLTDKDIEAACRGINPQANPKQLRQQLEQTGRSFVLRESAERLKANQWALEHAIVTIEEPVAPPSAAPVPVQAQAAEAQATAEDAPAADAEPEQAQAADAQTPVEEKPAEQAPAAEAPAEEAAKAQAPADEAPAKADAAE